MATGHLIAKHKGAEAAFFVNFISKQGGFDCKYSILLSHKMNLKRFFHNLLCKCRCHPMGYHGCGLCRVETWQEKMNRNSEIIWDNYEHKS